MPIVELCDPVGEGPLLALLAVPVDHAAAEAAKTDVKNGVPTFILPTMGKGERKDRKE